MNSKSLIGTPMSHIHPALTPTIDSSTRKYSFTKIFENYRNRLEFAQTWEDPETNLSALGLNPRANIVTIASGGCNALAYLSSNSSTVHAIDQNSSQLAMLEIKAQAIKHLPDYEAVLKFLGEANQVDNLKRYQRHIRKHLSTNASTFWQHRTFLGKPRYYNFTKQVYQSDSLGRFINYFHFIAKFFGGDLSKINDAKNREEQIEIFDRYVAPIFEKQSFQVVAKLIFPQVTDLKQFKEKLRHLACDFSISENCFAQQVFGRSFNTMIQTALPMYLQEKNFIPIRQNIDGLRVHHCTLLNFLQKQSYASIDAYMLIDSQDQMDQSQLNQLWLEIDRTAATGAKVLFRTTNQSTLLEKKLLISIPDRWKTKQQNNKKLLELDKSAIYNGVYLYEKFS
jgi:S-adenosylmethionine-diacylglycerol 3-amino-3-carboxypropyl transferase